MYKHFIITRFNLKLDNLPKIKIRDSAEQYNDWLKNRFYLFEKYCYPSIINQSCTDFYWLVLFDINTPPIYRQKIKQYEKASSLFKPIFLDNGDYDTVKGKFNEVADLYLDMNDEFVITTRIDNDDAFHKDMISSVQRCFNMQDDLFISFTYGFQYDIINKVFARIFYRNNHFISRIERRTPNINTVITYNHYSINEAGDVYYISNRRKPMWLEIIHKGNLINVLDPTSLPLISVKALSDFQQKGEISIAHTYNAFLKYFHLWVLTKRARALKGLGVYYFLKKIFKR